MFRGPPMSMQFQKPENALRRAQELHEVGNTEDALAMCAQVMSNRKWKNQSALGAMELIAIFALSTLVVKLKDLRTGRDILINYRSMTQTANTASLEKVVRDFRSAAEKLVEISDTATKEGIEVPEDLEALDTPDKAVRKALRPKAVRDHEAKERALLDNIR